MKFLDQNTPEEGFTFVDKRRTSTVEDVTVEDDILSDPSAEETEISDDESSVEPEHSTYELAAYCAGMLINEGFTRLGLIADQRTGKAVMDLPNARVAIDSVAALVQVLDEPGSTLPESVRREVKRTLNDLRLNYIDRAKQTAS